MPWLRRNQQEKRSEGEGKTSQQIADCNWFKFVDDAWQITCPAATSQTPIATATWLAATVNYIATHFCLIVAQFAALENFPNGPICSLGVKAAKERQRHRQGEGEEEKQTSGKWLWRATVANYQCDLCTLSKCVFLSAFHKFSPSVIHKMQTNKFAINCALGEKAIFHRVKGNTHSNTNNNN